MRLHVGGAPAEVAEFLESFMKDVSKGSPAGAFQRELVINKSSEFERLDDGAIEITTEGWSNEGRWAYVYRVEASAARPGTNLKFELTRTTGIHRVLASAINALALAGKPKRAWEKEFTRYVQERTGPSLRMTMNADLAGM